MARPREFDEAEVLQAAKACFKHKGYAGTSLADLTDATALGKGSLYGAFGDKHALFMHVLDDYCARSVAATEQMIAGDGPAIDRLRRYMLAIADGSASDVDGCLLASSTAELAGQDAQVAARVRATFTALGKLLETAIAEAQHQGDIDPHADPEALAAMLLAVARGIESLGTGGASRRTLRQTANTALAAISTA
jgi:TetR/AcrR family transcriptional regulator, transcriptional repressor for nem operon